MDRLASGEVVVELETQAKIDAEQTLAQGNEFNPQNPGNTPTNRSPHASSRSIHASSHSLAAPVGANGLLSYHSEELHTVCRKAVRCMEMCSSCHVPLTTAILARQPEHRRALKSCCSNSVAVRVSAWYPRRGTAHCNDAGCRWS